MVGFWQRIFMGGGKKTAAPEQSSGRVEAVIAELKARARPCLRLVAAEGGESWLGGAPTMSGEWPRYDGRPLSLIAQLDLAEIQAANGGIDWLPGQGRLLFFYELEHSSWGLNPEDQGSALVRYETDDGMRTAIPADLQEDYCLDRYPLTFAADTSLPDEERLGLDWKSFTRAEELALEKAVEELTPSEPRHQIGGYPGAIQGDDMELECQAMWRRLRHGDAKAAPTDWRLLLQLDTDPGPGMMWGDTGRLYFWISEQDARAGDFSKVWAILQCF